LILPFRFPLVVRRDVLLPETVVFTCDHFPEFHDTLALTVTVPRAESRAISTILATSVAGRLSAKRKIAMSFFDAGMRVPVKRRSRIDLEATANVILLTAQ
jgi:hypothetical protein